jgi:hypothetical protein
MYASNEPTLGTPSTPKPLSNVGGTPISSLNQPSSPQLADLGISSNPRSTRPPRTITSLGSDSGQITPHTFQQSNPFQAPPRRFPPRTHVVTPPLVVVPPTNVVSGGGVGGGTMGGGSGGGGEEQAPTEQPKSDNKGIWLILAILGGFYLLTK